MKLSEAGESRVRGYLFVLGTSLRSFLPPRVVGDALRELESHIRERVDQIASEPDERTPLWGTLIISSQKEAPRLTVRIF